MTVLVAPAVGLAGGERPFEHGSVATFDLKSGEQTQASPPTSPPAAPESPKKQVRQQDIIPT
jgi:hypothetical protein